VADKLEQIEKVLPEKSELQRDVRLLKDKVRGLDKEVANRTLTREMADSAARDIAARLREHSGSAVIDTLLRMTPEDIKANRATLKRQLSQAFERGEAILEETGKKVPVGARALEEIGISKKLLQAVRAKHHVFVQQLRRWFKSRGIDIDKYTIKLTADEHRLIHNEYRWNDIWKDFMEANPKASKRKLFAQMRTMLQEYGLEGLPIVPYK
jgi:hypothetical protein